MQSAYVHEFSGCAVWFTGIPLYVSLKASDLGDGFDEFFDGTVYAGPDVDVTEHGFCVGLVGVLVEVHDMNAGDGHVVYVEEFAHGCA